MPAPWLPIPHHKQQHRADCLAACVAMVLNYLGLSIRYSRLLKLLDISPDLGAPAPNIHKLSDLGIAVIYRHAGVLRDLEQNIAEGSPCITFVNTLHLSYWTETTRHTVVVAGLDAQQVYLYDPFFDNTPQTVAKLEFMLAWDEMDNTYAVLRRQHDE
jgi:ABC-type bacteriocin/lantibiotic exporter with double-glycine peptidase domain